MEPPLTLLLLLLFFSLSTASPITPAQRAQTTLPKPQRILCDACFLYMRRMGSTPSTPAICVAADGTYATSSAKCKLVRVEVYSKGLSISGISQRPNVRERVYFYLDEGGRVVAREQLMPVFIQQWGISDDVVSLEGRTKYRLGKGGNGGAITADEGGKYVMVKRDRNAFNFWSNYRVSGE